MFPDSTCRLQVKPDRRSNRLAVPPCSICGSVQTSVVIRTDNVLYVRCAGCHGLWSLRKVGLEAART